jgi:hypothetical protein
MKISELIDQQVEGKKKQLRDIIELSQKAKKILPEIELDGQGQITLLSRSVWIDTFSRRVAADLVRGMRGVFTKENHPGGIVLRGNMGGIKIRINLIDPSMCKCEKIEETVIRLVPVDCKPLLRDKA